MLILPCFRNWLGWGAYLQGVDGVNNRDAAHSINVSWQLPSDPIAYMKQGGVRYTLARDNGVPILLTDSDVMLHIVTNIYTYVRDENGNIIGLVENCFDHDNDNECDVHETNAYRSDNFKVSMTLPPSTSPSHSPTLTPSTSPSTSPSHSPKYQSITHSIA